MQKKTIYSAIIAVAIFGGWGAAMAIKSERQTAEIKANLPKSIIGLSDNSTIKSSTTIFFNTTTTITHPIFRFQGAEVQMDALQVSDIKLDQGRLAKVKLLAENVYLGEDYVFGAYRTNQNEIGFVLDAGASYTHANMAFALSGEPIFSIDVLFNQPPMQVLAYQSIDDALADVDALRIETHIPSSITRAFVDDALQYHPNIWVNPIYPAIDMALSYQGNQVLATTKWHEKGKVYYSSDFQAQFDKAQISNFIDYVNGDADTMDLQYTILKQNSSMDLDITMNVAQLGGLIFSGWLDAAQVQSIEQSLEAQGLKEITLQMKGKGSYNAQKSNIGKNQFELALLPLFGMQGNVQFTSLQGDGIAVDMSQPYAASGLLSFMDMPSDTTRLDQVTMEFTDIAGIDKTIQLISSLSGMSPDMVSMMVKSHLEDHDSQVLYSAFMAGLKDTHPNMPINDGVTLPVREWMFQAGMQLFDGQKSVGFELNNTGDYSLEQIAMAMYLAQAIVFTDFPILYDENDVWTTGLVESQQKLTKLNAEINACQQTISKAQENKTTMPTCDLNGLQGQQAQLQQHISDMQDDLNDISGEKKQLYREYLDALKTLQGVAFKPQVKS